MSAGANQQLIVSELLAFLQQKLDVMDEVSAIQICSTNFSVSDICAAKQTLYQSLNRIGTFFPHRRGDETGKKTLQDVIKVLKETDPDVVPTFVARELAKLPPVTFDHVDVTCLLKDIVALKASLAEVRAKCEASEIVIAELRNEVACLRCSGPTAAEAANSTAVVDQRGLENICGSSVVLQTDPLTQRVPPAAPPAPQPALPRQSLPVHNPPQGSRPAARRPHVPPQAPQRAQPTQQPSQKKNQVDKEGFILVRKKSKVRKQPRKSQCGTAAPESDSVLRAATPNTPLYVSRLHHSSTATDVAEFVRKGCGYSLKVSPLESRHYVHFKSYVVHVPTPFLDTVASPDFWPKDVVFRRFRGTLRATEPTQRMPTK